MPNMESKQRLIRALPGRVRMDVVGLKSNTAMAECIYKQVGSQAGIIKVTPCVDTGRVLFTYDENQISLYQICEVVRMIEEQNDTVSQVLSVEQTSIAEDMVKETTNGSLYDFGKEVAITGEPGLEGQGAFNRYQLGSVSTDIPESFHKIPTSGKSQLSFQNRRGTGIPISLTLSVGGLAIIGAKQLLMGRSGLARSPALFHLASFFSIATGYSFLKQGLHRFSRDKSLNWDMMLGTGAFALACMRENVVALAGISILQYVNWKRRQALLLGHEDGNTDGYTDGYIDHGNKIPLDPAIQKYSETASKWGMVLSGATLAVTRDPLRAIAVLLAANPRIATIATEFAWRQAEIVTTEKGSSIPAGGSLAQLARTRTILIEDAAAVLKEASEEIQCVSNLRGEEEDKIWCVAASLMKQTDHPWKERVMQKAKDTGRTIRTAFHVEQTADGIKAELNSVPAFVGSRVFMEENQVDCTEYQFQARQVHKKGYQVLYVAKQMEDGLRCLGLLMQEQVSTKADFEAVIRHDLLKHCTISILHNESKLDRHSHPLNQLDLDMSWSSLREEEVMERITQLRKQGEEVLYVTGDSDRPLYRCVQEWDIPTVYIAQLPSVCAAYDDVRQTEQLVNQHFRFTKVWNGIGSILAATSVAAAPLVNLASDAILLLMLTRVKRKTEHKPFLPLPKARQEQWFVQHEAAASIEPLNWHSMTTQDVLDQFGVDEKRGLMHEQVCMVKGYYGPNQLQPKQVTKWSQLFLRQFKEFTPLILLSASALSIFTGGVFDGLAMTAILLANAAISAVQEKKAEQVMDKLNQFQPTRCRVIRDGREHEIMAADLVPGDVVCLEAGDRVPADIRILHAWNAQVNEATLTGESLPVEKINESVDEDCPLSEQCNMLFMGTDLTSGKCTGIVVSIGKDTQMGQLIDLMKDEQREVTPLQRKVTSISKTFFKGALLAGGLVFVTGLLRGVPFTQMITTSITLAASAVPEGLPITITIALSAGIFRMARKNALIRKLSALETLGRTTVICTDKTGTLTKNEMTVKTVSTVNRTWIVTGDGYEPKGTFHEISPEVAVTSALSSVPNDPAGHLCKDTVLSDDPDLERLLHIALLCNNSKLEKQAGEWIVRGDPTEGALVSLAAKKGLKQETISQWTRCHEVPFDSKKGSMSVVCYDTDIKDTCYLFSKGSVEVILERCSRYQDNGKLYTLTEEHKKQILEQNEKLAREALRVLAFAYCPMEWEEGSEDVAEEEMIYVGLTGMMDPPKAEVEQSIQEANALGVRPVMITGDHPITAIAIAKQLGIWDAQKKVVAGYELDRMTDQELKSIVEDVCIFARVTPEHKLRIVAALQECGHIVTMTGDGVNDSPAIKKANVGIAMGKTGTDVTKETADMVLKEDHFGSIVEGVKEGRTIIGNIRKAIGCLLTGNLAEIFVTTAAVVMGMPIPLVPIQILLMNLLTDALPAMVLAMNPGNKVKETRRQDIVDTQLYTKVITRGILLGTGSLALFATSLAAGVSLPVAQTMAFVTLVIGQLVQTFSWKQEGSEQPIRTWTKDRFLMGSLSISLLALLAVLYVPSISALFHTAPLTVRQWIPILAVAGSITTLSKPIFQIVSAWKSRPMPSMFAEQVV